MIDFISWQGKTLADHRALTLKSIAEGYRFVSLSIYGDAGAPVYAAVMDKQNPAPNPTVSSALFAVNPLKPD